MRHVLRLTPADNGTAYRCSCKRSTGWTEGGFAQARRLDATAHANMPHRHPRLAFAAHCLRRWTIDLAWDGIRALTRGGTP